MMPSLPRDLMSWPFFSIAKTPRHLPIVCNIGAVHLEVAPSGRLPVATIWDADIIVWAVSALRHAHARGKSVSVHVPGSPAEILRFTRRGEGAEKYDRLRDALDRLAGTRVTTTLGVPSGQDRVTFPWIVAWQERRGMIDLILPDWLHGAVTASRGMLTLNHVWFGLTGGLERWLYLLARRHAGRQPSGWSFDLAHLYRKSPTAGSRKRFNLELRGIVSTQGLPGYRLVLTGTTTRGTLSFLPVAATYPQGYVDKWRFSVDNAVENRS
ncbi:replication initiator protein A [Komagataeibacter intermedius]